MNDWERSIVENLRDAGGDEDFIQCFMELSKNEELEAQLKLLGKHRTGLLDSLHTEQKRIDRLDFLIYKLKREKTAKKHS